LLDHQLGAELVTVEDESCPRLKIRFGSTFAAALNETIKILCVFFRNRVGAIAGSDAKPTDEKFHAHDFSILCFWAFFPPAVKKKL